MADAASDVRPLPLFESGDQLRVRTWSQFVRTFYRMQRRVVAMLATHDITLPQFDVLATLRYSEGASQQELAERLLVSKGNVCGVLDRLERLGWVRRRPDPQDGRTNRLYLTTAGKKQVDALLPEHDALLIRTMAAVADANLKRFRRTLEELDLSADLDPPGTE